MTVLAASLRCRSRVGRWRRQASGERRRIDFGTAMGNWERGTWSQLCQATRVVTQTSHLGTCVCGWRRARLPEASDRLPVHAAAIVLPPKPIEPSLIGRNCHEHFPLIFFDKQLGCHKVLISVIPSPTCSNMFHYLSNSDSHLPTRCKRRNGLRYLWNVFLNNKCCA